MTEKNLHIAIISAGNSTRNRPQTLYDRLPKCLVSIDGEAALLRQLAFWSKHPDYKEQNTHVVVREEHREITMAFLQLNGYANVHVASVPEANGSLNALMALHFCFDADSTIMIQWADIVPTDDRLLHTLSEETSVIFQTNAHNLRCAFDAETNTITYDAVVGGVIGMYYMHHWPWLGCTEMPMHPDGTDVVDTMCEKFTPASCFIDVIDFGDSEKWHKVQESFPYANSNRGTSITSPDISQVWLEKAVPAEEAEAVVTWYANAKKAGLKTPIVHLCQRGYRMSRVFGKTLYEFDEKTIIRHYLPKIIEQLELLMPVALSAEEQTDLKAYNSLVETMVTERLTKRLDAIEPFVQPAKLAYLREVANYLSDELYSPPSDYQTYCGHGDFHLLNCLIDTYGDVWFIDPKPLMPMTRAFEYGRIRYGLGMWSFAYNGITDLDLINEYKGEKLPDALLTRDAMLWCMTNYVALPGMFTHDPCRLIKATDTIIEILNNAISF